MFDRIAAQRPAAFPAHATLAVPGAVGGHADRRRRLRRVPGVSQSAGRRAPAGADADAGGLVRPALLRSDALRCVGVQDARRRPRLQPLAVTEGLDPDRDGCRAQAEAVADSQPHAAAPADTRAHARPDADGPLALARPDAHLAAAAQLAPAAQLAAARSWLAVAGSAPPGLLVTVVVSGSGSVVVMICPDPSLASAV